MHYRVFGHVADVVEHLGPALKVAHVESAELTQRKSVLLRTA